MATLEITDGTTTIDLAAGDLRLDIDGWGPAIAGRRTSELGGAGVYADVEEALRLIADGPSPGAAWGELQRLLDQARRWQLGDPAAAAVRLRARPDCSRLPAGVVLEVPLLGGATGPYADTWRRTLPADVVGPMDASVQRRGAWLSAAYEAASSSSVAAQQVMSVTLPSAQEHDCPLSAAVVQMTGAAAVNYVCGGLLLAPAAGAIQAIDAETMTADFWASVPDATARGGAVLRLIAVVPNAPYETATVAIAPVRMADIYIVARCPVAPAAPFRVRAALFDSFWGLASAAADDSGIWTDTISVSSTIPNLYALGTIAAPDNTSIDAIRLLASTPDVTGSPQIQIDTIVVLSHDYGTPYPILFPDAALPNAPAVVGKAADALGMTVLTIDHRPLEAPAARIGQAKASAPFGTIRRAPTVTVGSPDLWMRGGAVAGWMSISNGADFISNGGPASAAYTYQLQVRRWPARLTLE